MRLNVGCGNNYIPGYVNIDQEENGIADKTASAYALDFVKDGSVDEISSYQLIEHLGLVKAYRTAAHWARKLKPGGRLIIETLDLQNSLGSLIKKETKGNADWLFGTGDRGQNHVRPLSLNELKNMLGAAGFKNVRKKKPLGYWKTNAVRVEAVMGKDASAANTIEAWTAQPMDQGVFYSLPLNKIPKKASRSFVMEMTLISPELAITISNDKKVLKKLAKDKLVQRMFCSLSSQPIQQLDQMKAVKKVRTLAGSVVKNALSTGKVVWRDLPLEKGYEKDLNVYKFSNYFCNHSINELAMHYCSLGIKAFSKNEFKLSKAYFLKSLGFHRENTISWWNLARVLWILGKKEEADDAFNAAYKLSRDPSIKDEMKRKVPFKIPKELSYASQV